jgi:hypothetical protein
MYFSSFFVITGIVLNVVCHTSSVPITLCTGKNGYMTGYMKSAEETQILSILKNENDRNTILVKSNRDKGFEEKFKFTCYNHANHSWSMYDLIVFFICIRYSLFSLKGMIRFFDKIDAKLHQSNQNMPFVIVAHHNIFRFYHSCPINFKNQE